MIEVGRLCIKTAGRDAGQKCVILDVDEGYALIDGQTRRKKVNLKHLEPLDDTIKIKKNSSHSDVVKELKKKGIEVKEKIKKDTKKKEKSKDKGKKEKKAKKEKKKN